MADLLRKSRQWLTSRLTAAAMSAAPALPARVIDGLESVIARVGPWSPVLAGMVADNMRAVGLYSREVHRDYFSNAAAHLAGVMQVFRYHGRDERGKMHPELAWLVEQRVLLDDSFERLREAVAMGKGVVLLGVHASNFMLVLARMNQELPITVYLRHSRDPQKQLAKRRWCEITGLDFIAEPASVVNPARRAEIMAEALQAGRVLVITPDLALKREEGTPVRFFDREVFLPGGPVALSLVVQAPLVTVVAAPAAIVGGPAAGSVARRPAGRECTSMRAGNVRSANGAIVLRFFGPMNADVPQRGRGWRQEAARERLQWFTDILVNEFLRPHPALWFLWGDKRWTRVFRGDLRYTRRLD